MLRLRPSELTLAPDDVDETFRRISLRHASTASQHSPMRPHGQPGCPILRRGPQRATRDAITALGNIPILQPHQAVLTSVNQEDSVFDQEATGPPLHHDPAHHRNAEAAPAVPPLPHAIQLPLRSRPDRHALGTNITSDEQGESASSTPQNLVPEPARSGSPGITTNGNEQSAQSPPLDFTASAPGLRGGGSLAGTTHAHARDGPRDNVHAHSPLHQVQKLSSPAQRVSPGDPIKPPTNPSTDNPTPHSSGCSTQTPQRSRCHSHRRLPNSEPRHSSGPRPTITRSLSSGATPSSNVTCQSKSPPHDPSDDVCGMSTVTERSPRRHRGSYSLSNRDGSVFYAMNFTGLRPVGQTSAPPRQRSSDATSTSTGYSWYGSLSSDTRFPSSGEHSHNEASSAQLDGVGTTSHGPSPLPSMPYTRIQNESAPPSQTSGNSRQISAGYVEAATAVAHDLQSPLDPYAEHYQRRARSHRNLLNHPTYANPANPSVSSVGGTPVIRPSSGRGSQLDNVARHETSPNSVVFRQQQHCPEHQAYSTTYDSAVFVRNSRSSRVEHCSSENAPVSVPVSHGDATRHGRVHAQRVAYERLHNSTETMYPRTMGGSEIPSPRHVVPHNMTRHDRPNRARDYTPHDLATTGMPRDGDEFHPDGSLRMRRPRHASQGQTQHVVDAESPRASHRLALGQHRAEFAGRPATRVYRSGSDTFSLQPRRDGPLSALASFEQGSGTTSRHRYSPIIRATPTATGRTYRRVGPEQRDQENDGDGGLMRREEANVAARYGGEQQQQTMMNETPPRIGRVERRMME